MKRLLAILLALTLLLSGLALAEPEETGVALETVEAEEALEAELVDESAEEAEETVIGEANDAEALAEANEDYPVETVKNKGKVTLQADETVQLAVSGQKIKSCKMKNAKSKKVASVTKKGVLTAKKAGTAKLIITTKKNKKVTVTVKVVAEPAPFTGELSDCFGMTMKDAVSKVGGDPGLIRKGAVSDSYEAAGILLADMEISPISLYYGMVNYLSTSIPTATVLGFAAGDSLAEDMPKAEAMGYEKDDNPLGDVTAYAKDIMMDGQEYEDYLAFFCDGDQVVTVARSILAVDDPDRPHEKLELGDLSQFIGMTLEAARTQIGWDLCYFEDIEGQTDLGYYDDFTLCSVYEEAGSETSGLITMVTAQAEGYTVKGITVGMTRESAEAKAAEMGFVVKAEDIDDTWTPATPAEGVEEYYYVYYEDGKVADVAYTWYRKPGQPVSPADPTALKLDKELTNYVGQALPEVVKAIGGDAKDISAGYEDRWTSYEVPNTAIGFQAFKDMETTNKFYDKLNYILCGEKGYTIRGFALDDNQADVQSALEAQGYAFSMESGIEGGVFRIYTKEYTENGAPYTEEVQFDAVNGKITCLWFHTY